MEQMTAAKVLDLTNCRRRAGFDKFDVSVNGEFFKIVRVRWSESGANIVWIQYRDGMKVRTLPVAASDKVWIR